MLRLNRLNIVICVYILRKKNLHCDLITSLTPDQKNIKYLIDVFTKQLKV